MTNDDMREAVARAIGRILDAYGITADDDDHTYSCANAAIAAAEPGLRRKHRAEFLDEIVATTARVAELEAQVGLITQCADNLLNHIEETDPKAFYRPMSAFYEQLLLACHPELEDALSGDLGEGN